MAAKANREVTEIKPSVLRQWQPKTIEKSQIIKSSVLWQWQPNTIEKSL